MEPGHLDATRSVYDETADQYARLVGTEIGEATETAFDVAVLEEFATRRASGPGGPVADLGCGPGRVAAFLARRGLGVVGLDLSAAMVAVARRTHAGLPFGVGRIEELPVRSSSLGGVVGWYSIIHTPPAGLPAVCREFRRVLVGGGALLLAFQSGDGTPVRRERAHGTELTMINHRHAPEVVAETLAAADFRVESIETRSPQLAHEATPQTFVTAIAGV